MRFTHRDDDAVHTWRQRYNTQPLFPRVTLDRTAFQYCAVVFNRLSQSHKGSTLETAVIHSILVECLQRNRQDDVHRHTPTQHASSQIAPRHTVVHMMSWNTQHSRQRKITRPDKMARFHHSCNCVHVRARRNVSRNDRRNNSDHALPLYLARSQTLSPLAACKTPSPNAAA